MKLAKYIKDRAKKEIIFDFDDTIFCLRKGGVPAWRGVCEIVKKVDESLISEFEDSPTQIYKLSNKAIILYGQKIKNHLMSFFNQFELELKDIEKRNDQIIEFIRNNFNVYNFHIWSSNTLNLLYHVLKKYDLLDKFISIIGRDSVDLAKPYPDGFYQIVGSSSFERKDFLMVGDGSGDKQASINAGIDFFRIEKDKVKWR